MAVKKNKAKQAVKNIKVAKKLKKVLIVKKKKVLNNKKIKLAKKPVALESKKKSIIKKTIVLKKKVFVKVKMPVAKNKPFKKAKPDNIKKVVYKKIRKQAEKNAPAEFAAESLFKARIKVIGIGGGGGSIVSEIGRSLEKATFVIADTDIRALKKRNGIKYLWFGEELTHGLGTGVNVDLAKQAAESAREKISGLFKDQDIIIFIASLGGGLGSGATQVFADAAREFGGITLGIFTLPFKFEGKNKNRIAQNALKSLRSSLNVSLTIPNEKIFKIIDANTPILNAFSIVNRSLIESLESLIDLIYNPGIINIDFADLRTILKGRGNSAFLNTVEESGKDRVEKICEKVLVNPLLQNSSFDAEKILFNIAGSENLSMFEVEKISSHIANLNPKAKIIFGISKNSKLKNKIKTTILMTGGELKDEVAEKKSEPVELAVKEQIEEIPVVKKKIVVAKENKKPKIKKINKTKSKKSPPEKPQRQTDDKKEPEKENTGEKEQISIIPVFKAPVSTVPVLEQRRMNIVETIPDLTKKTIRRSGLEIKKAEEQEEKKKIAQEKEWEIPAFLRRVKYKG